MKRFAIVALLVLGCGGGTTATVTPTSPTVDSTPEPAAGSGVVTFGTAYDPDTLLITSPKSTFKRTVKTIAWSASLSEPAGATSLTFILASVSKSGVEVQIGRTDVEVTNPAFTVIAYSEDLAGIVDNKAGSYVLRYLRDSTVLAEGQFTLT